MSQGVKPWRRLRRGLEQDYTVARVRQDWWADPRTEQEHPRVRVDCADWVTVIAVTPDEQLVLVRQFRFGVDASTLEVPGGIVEPGEPPEQAAARELEEETGYVPGRLVPLGQVHPNPAFQGNVCFSFVALDCVKRHDGRQDAGEDITVELHPRAALPQLILEGHITHSLVVAAFLLERLRAESTGTP